MSKLPMVTMRFAGKSTSLVAIAFAAPNGTPPMLPNTVATDGGATGSRPHAQRQTTARAGSRRAMTPPPRRLSEEHLGHRIERRVHGLEIRRRFGERNRYDLVSAERGHLAEVAPMDHVGGLHPEAGGEDAIEGGRGSAALDVTEDGDPGLVAGLRLDEVGELLTDAAEADVAELVELLGGGRLLGAELGAFRDDDDGEVLVLRPVPVLDVLADLVDVDRLLRNEDHVRAAGHPGMHRDPTRVAAHHLA